MKRNHLYTSDIDNVSEASVFYDNKENQVYLIFSKFINSTSWSVTSLVLLFLFLPLFFIIFIFIFIFIFIYIFYFYFHFYFIFIFYFLFLFLFLYFYLIYLSWIMEKIILLFGKKFTLLLVQLQILVFLSIKTLFLFLLRKVFFFKKKK